jgi:hypothetical protein
MTNKCNRSFALPVSFLYSFLSFLSFLSYPFVSSTALFLGIAIINQQNKQACQQAQRKRSLSSPFSKSTVSFRICSSLCRGRWRGNWWLRIRRISSRTYHGLYECVLANDGVGRPGEYVERAVTKDVPVIKFKPFAGSAHQAMQGKYSMYVSPPPSPLSSARRIAYLLPTRIA